MGQGLNFTNQNLRDRSFKGKNLIGADFSGADIRGCSFHRAQLRDANFNNVRAGKSPRQLAKSSATLFLITLLFAGTAMITTIVITTFAITFFAGIANVNRDTIYWVAVVAIIVFAVAFAIAFTSSCLILGKRITTSAIILVLIVAFASGFLGSTFVKILIAGAFTVIANSLRVNIWLSLVAFLAIEPLQIFGSLYLFRIAVTMSRTATGTGFQYADLTNASFRNATLVSCDFSHAIVQEVNWEQAQISGCKL